MSILQQTVILPLTIVVCTINPDSCLYLVKSLLKYIKNDQVIIIIDGKKYDTCSDIHKLDRWQYNVTVVVTEDNCGFSYSRNLGMQKASNRYIIFFDDDIIIFKDVISRYRQLFLEGYTMLGGPLILPKSYPRIPFWLPLGLSSLLGIHTNQAKIWGGNFGFELMHSKNANLYFELDLGRKGKKLLSGEDTTFIQKYNQIHGKTKFDIDLAVEHHIKLNRFSIMYLVRRAFWQGRSEVRRHSFLRGLEKEFKRSFSVEESNIIIKLICYFSGAFLFLAYFSGCVYEFFINQINFLIAKCSK
ncbi:glycosyltransferase family 2 protein [Microcoleus sp. OTE_8_concoct_300]|uniref:glycosyltransferase family 2 protein n=1 Tax=Microcoleus sp. OTE_8_concoct_300 TaxID=2964710 RepID=UPI00403F7DE3